MEKPTKNLRKNKIVAAFIAIVFLVSTGITVAEKSNISFVPTWNEIFDKVDLNDNNVTVSDFKITFVDVGQGDCAIIQSNGLTAMIDGGEAENADKILRVLQNYGVETLEYVFATHPHSDHIGGIPTVIKNVKCNNFIMPKLPDKIVPTTSVYKNLLTAVQESGAKAKHSKVGDEISLGDCKITVVGPVQNEKELNNTSLVLLVEYKTKSFLFTGDMEKTAEKHLLEKTTFDLDVDVMKVGHHGSRTATSQGLIDISSPTFLVVSSGLYNKYGHPSSEFLKIAEKNKLTVYRTDTSSDITCIVQDNVVVFNFEKGA